MPVSWELQVHPTAGRKHSFLLLLSVISSREIRGGGEWSSSAANQQSSERTMSLPFSVLLVVRPLASFVVLKVCF